MNLHERISALAALGQKLGEIVNGQFLSPAAVRLGACIAAEHQFNGWFTPANVKEALAYWAGRLNTTDLENWCSAYTFHNRAPKHVAVIMAGNIPLVGMHDFLAVLLSGNRIIAKLSSDDHNLLPAVALLLTEIEPRFDDYIRIADGKLEKMDAIIATGSNNSSRYFEYYFSKYPHIIRKNRHSVAVITGNETPEEMKGLSDDIFRYFGLGCRSVSKLFVPAGYKFDPFFESVYHWGEAVLACNKYINNYDYNKAVYLLNNIKLFDNNFLMLKEDIGLTSPASVLFYEYYAGEDELLLRLRADAENLQCVVSNRTFPNLPNVAFGHTQNPALDTYADGVDTLAFLLNI